MSEPAPLNLSAILSGGSLSADGEGTGVESNTPWWTKQAFGVSTAESKEESSTTEGGEVAEGGEGGNLEGGEVASGPAVLPHGWIQRHSSSHHGLPYYFHPATGKSQWTVPVEGDIIPTPPDNPSSHPFSSAFTASSAPPPVPAGKVRASHILVKHKQSRRPSSWKEAEITRSRAEAINIITKFREQLLEIDAGDLPKAFAELATKESDCSSAKRGGDLGSFGRGEMQKPFEDATFALNVGELSDVISTESGIHVILRTG